MKLGPCLSVLLLAACSSVEWREGAPTDLWRGNAIRHTDAARVAARNEAAAADVHRSYETVRDVVAKVCAVVPEPPLLLAIDDGDEPLMRDAMRTLESVTTWQREHVACGAAPQASVGTFGPRELPDHLLSALARIAAGAVPLAAAELALPATWRDGVSWCFVMPTENAIATATDATLDYGIEEEDLSLVERALLAPFMPLLRSTAREKLRAQVQRQMLDATLAVVRRQGKVPADATERCLRELGLDEDPASEAIDDQGLQDAPR